MRLEIHQDFVRHDPVEVAAAFADPDVHAAFADLPFVGTPQLVGHDVADGVTTVAVRYRVDVDLPAAARAFVDPARLTFVEHARLGGDGSGTFHLVPDHYPRLVRFAGTIAIGGLAGIDAGDGQGTRRIVAGDLGVDLGWKGKLVEGEVTRVIASGLTRALVAQVPAIERHLG